MRRTRLRARHAAPSATAPDGGEQARERADRTGKRQPPEKERRRRGPGEPDQPSRRRAAPRPAPRRLPPARAALPPPRRGGGPGGPCGGQPGPRGESQREHQVREHVGAEVGGIAERAAHARQVLLGDRGVQRDFHPMVPGDDQAGHRRPGASAPRQQSPPGRAGAQHRHQHHRKRHPVRAVHDPLHALVVRPQTALQARAETGREQRHREGGGERHQHPGSRRTVGRVGERQHRPQGERHRDHRARPQRLADHEGKDRLRRNHERRQQHQPDAGEDAKPQPCLPCRRPRRHPRRPAPPPGGPAKNPAAQARWMVAATTGTSTASTQRRRSPITAHAPASSEA